MGLKESKELCQEFYDDLTKLDDFSFFKEEDKLEEVNEFENPDNELELFNNIKAMLLNNRKLMAVKYAKEALKIGLKEAKELVDSLEEAKGTKEVIIAGENEDLLIELDDEENNNDQTLDLSTVLEMTDEIIDINQKKNEPATILKKEKDKPHYVSHAPITFGKVEKFDRQKKKKRTTSGCMITMTFMIAVIILIAVGI